MIGKNVQLKKKGNKMKDELSKFTIQQLLYEILQREPLKPAPEKIKFAKNAEWSEAIIGIGIDNTAFIYLTLDGYLALRKEATSEIPI